MNLVDVHCHLDEVFYKNSIKEVIDRARLHNVRLIIPAGINPETNRLVLRLEEQFPDIIFPALGLYPPDALKKEGLLSQENFDIDSEIEFIHSNIDRICAIGEVGMDFKNGQEKEQQEALFRKMILLAIETKKPLIIHSRKAEETVISILEEYKYPKIVMHCFSGGQKLVRRIRENNWFFSIPTSAVRDEHFQRIVKETRLHQLLTETDSPFLSPYKGQMNEPSFVIETIKLIARLRNMPEEDVANIIFENAKRLFSK